MFKSNRFKQSGGSPKIGITLIKYLCAALAVTSSLFLAGCGGGGDGVSPPTRYTVTVTGGTGGEVYAVGDTVTITADTAQSGKRFKDWTADPEVKFADSGKEITSFIMPASDVAVTAHYEDITYLLTLYRGTISPSGAGGYFAAGDKVTIVANNPNAGEHFKNWTANAEVEFEDENSPVTALTVPASNVAVTANFAEKFKVTYNGNGNTGGAAPSDTNSPYFSGSAVEVLGGGNLSKTGFAFGGWNMAADGSGYLYEAGDTLYITDNITLYAKWLPIYTVTLNANGGIFTQDSIIKAVHGQTLGELSLPTPQRTGFDFTGWYSDTSGGTKYNNAYVFTGDVTFYAQWEWVVNSGTFTDTRNGQSQTYKTVVMPDGKTWMAENLNYEPSTGNSWCYKDSGSYCTEYGRLYDWSTAMNIDSAYNDDTWGGSDENHQGICPAGWHLPSNAEWNDLVTAVGGSSTAGTKLKSKTGWNSYSGIPFGTDDYGFSALPGGYRFSGGNFYSVGYNGYWWSATEDGASLARYRYMRYDLSNVSEGWDLKSDGRSVRCLRD